MKITREYIRGLIVEEIDKREVLNEMLPALLPMLPAVAGASSGVAGTGAILGVGLSGAGWAVLGGLLAGSLWWKMKSAKEKERMAAEVKKRGLEDAFTLYVAMKGLGTKVKPIRDIFTSLVIDSGDLTASVKKLYSDFDNLLAIVDDAGSGDLIEWLVDDDMDDEATVVRYIVKGQIQS